jgi:hypothetical protein
MKSAIMSSRELPVDDLEDPGRGLIPPTPKDKLGALQHLIDYSYCNAGHLGCMTQVVLCSDVESILNGGEGHD